VRRESPLWYFLFWVLIRVTAGTLTLNADIGCSARKRKNQSGDPRRIPKARHPFCSDRL